MKPDAVETMEVSSNSAFWGLVLRPGKRYEQIVERSFHVSMAVLDRAAADNSSNTQVMIETDNQEFILCHLSKNKVFQQPLNLNFEAGDSLAFHVDGDSPSAVHLTGYYLDAEDDDGENPFEMASSSEDEGGEEVPELVPADSNTSKSKKNKKLKEVVDAVNGETTAKRKGDALNESTHKKKKLEAADDEDSDEAGSEEENDEEGEEGEEEEEDGDDEEVEEGFSEDAEDDDDDDEGDDDDDDEEEDDEEESDDSEDEANVTPLKKQQTPKLNGTGDTGKKEKATPNKPKQDQTPSKPKEDKTPNKKTPAPQGNKTPVTQEKAQPQTPKSAKKTLSGGVMIEELIVGNGPVAKRGKSVAVYYVGRLKQNNKQFDATTGGPGFKFRLGGKEVIKGWDIGVEGMKVGGKRRITCPPHMAYGARGSPPVIPPNSTLVFEVTLKNVN